MSGIVDRITYHNPDNGWSVLRVLPFNNQNSSGEIPDTDNDSALYEFRIEEPVVPYETELTIPDKFRHVNIDRVLEAQSGAEELLAVLKKVHPWSSLH